MENIIKELLNGQIEVLFELNFAEEEKLFNLIKNHPLKKAVLYKIIPLLIEHKKWFIYDYIIFDLIYQDSEYTDLVYYLLNEKLVSFSRSRAIKLIEKTSWGADYLLNNMEEIVEKNYLTSNNVIYLLLEKIIGNNELFNQRVTILYYSKNYLIRRSLIMYLLEKNISIDDKFIIGSLYENPAEFLYKQLSLPGFQEVDSQLLKTDLPYQLSKIENESIKELLIRNFSLFFKAEIKNKIGFIKNINYVEEEIKEKYQEMFRLYEEIKIESKKSPHGSLDLDEVFTKIINSNRENYFIEFTKKQSIKYENFGSRATAFKIGNDKILKFSRGKHHKNNIMNHFLIAPTKTLIIDADSEFPIVIEQQEYLTKIHNGVEMTIEDIECFLEEARKQGIIIADCHCKNKKLDNFGFLKDYRDATLVGIASYNDLPEWFKKRPVVLFDIDLVYYDINTDKQSSKTNKQYVKN